MSSSELTPRRQEILDYIIQMTRERGYPPTVREIGRAVGLASSSSVHFHLRALEKAGYLERDGSLTRALRPRLARPVQTTRYVPLVGKVAAGEPLLAQQNIEDFLPFPEGYIPEGESFLLRVQGDSMIKAGILDGDLVIVRRQPTAENGDIVVALLGEEATIKRFFRHAHAVELRPENDMLEPIITREAHIIGKVCGLIRIYP